VLTHPQPRSLVALAILTTGAMALAIAGVQVLRALRPRLAPGAPSRFSFPHLADADLDELLAGDANQIRQEAWTQARTLARIARTKYRCLRRALTCAVGAGILYLLWVVLR
jgi:hypothetical protein